MHYGDVPTFMCGVCMVSSPRPITFFKYRKLEFSAT